MMRTLILIAALILVPAVNAALPPSVSSMSALLVLPKGDGTVETGSGLLYQNSNRLFVITAKHVLFDIASPTRPLVLHSTNMLIISWDGDKRNEIQYNLGAYYQNNEVRYSESRDVAVACLGRVTTNGQWAFHTGFTKGTGDSPAPAVTSAGIRKFDAVFVAQDVYTFGYPTSVGSQMHQQLNPQRPLARKGIVADVDHVKKHIVLDIPVYFGNSGGPAIVVDEIAPMQWKYSVIGIVTQFVPFEDVWTSQKYKIPHITWSNSGYSIVEPIESALELLWE